MSELFPPTLVEEILCIRRELAMRERVYPRWVAEGKMKPAMAEREIAWMRAVLDRLTALDEGEADEGDHPKR